MTRKRQALAGILILVLALAALIAAVTAESGGEPAPATPTDLETEIRKELEAADVRARLENEFLTENALKAENGEYVFRIALERANSENTYFFLFSEESIQARVIREDGIVILLNWNVQTQSYDTLSFNTRFKRVRDSEEPKAISGTIDYTLMVQNPFSPEDTVKFEIRILDRALHESNVIQTEPIYTGRRDALHASCENNESFSETHSMRLYQNLAQ